MCAVLLLHIHVIAASEDFGFWYVVAFARAAAWCLRYHVPLFVNKLEVVLAE